jgi:hypothetical protein
LLRDPPTNLYTLDLSTASAVSLGQVGTGADTMRDISAFRTSNAFSFSSASYSANETAGVATITVNRSNSFGTASVAYATSNGSAQSPSDYTAQSGTLSLANGQSSATFDVAVADDASSEKDETVNLSLSAPSGGAASLGSPASAVLTIQNNAAPVFSAVGMTNRVFAAGRRSTKKVDLSRRKVKVGTTFKYRLSEAATVTIAIQRRKRRKVAGTLTRTGKIGSNRIKFSGRIGKKRLRPGRYTATLEARDKAGNRSIKKTVRFRIVRG